MNLPKKLLRSLTASAVALAVIGITIPAFACGHSMRIKQDPRADLVAKAERQLRRGALAKAAKLAHQVTGAIALSQHDKRIPQGFKSLRKGSRIESRARRILAVAAIRLDGKLKLVNKVAKKANDRAANVAWAVAEIRSQLKSRANDTFLQTVLGEGLSKSKRTSGEALRVLGQLADKDMMADAYGYAALAGLRASEGDQVGSDQALTSCRKMARDAKICRANGARISHNQN